MRLSFRDATEDDLKLLWRINSLGLGDVVRREFSVTARQHRQHFQEHFRIDDNLQIIFVDGEDAGYLAYESLGDHIYVSAVVLLPQFQNRGVGSKIMKSIFQEAMESGVDVRLQVLKSNPARAFYEGLGFVIDAETAHHYQMVKANSPR